MRDDCTGCGGTSKWQTTDAGQRDARAAEAAFKKATAKPVDLPPPKPTIPNAKEMVSLRLDRDILDHFQAEGPGWQDRINDALRKLIGK